MAKTASLNHALALVLFALCASEARGVTPAGLNPPGLNGNSSEAGNFVGRDPEPAAGSRKPKPAANTADTPVNTAGAKGATAAARKDGRVFLTRSASGLEEPDDEPRAVKKAPPKTSKTKAAVAKKSATARRNSPRGRPTERADAGRPAAVAKRPPSATKTLPPVAQGPPPDSEPAEEAMPAPRVELNKPAEAALNFPPPPKTAPASRLLPGMDPPAEPHPAAPKPPAELERPAKPAPLAATTRPGLGSIGGPGSSGGGAPAPEPLGPDLAAAALAPEPQVILGTLTRRSGVLSQWQVLLWSSATVALLLLILGLTWLRGLAAQPWASYREDWVNGFLWRWEWKQAGVKNLRGFCPACQSEVLFRPVAATEAVPGTWAFCPQCREATCLEVPDLTQTVAQMIARRRDSGEYRQGRAGLRSPGAADPGQEVRIKTIDGRLL